MMDIEKLIEDLHGILKQYGEKIPYGELVGAPWPYSRAGDLVWPDPEPYFIEQAATALSTLQDENEKLRVEAEGMRSNWYKSVEEIKKLRAELEQVKAERDAAIADIAAILAEVEEIRRGYGVDNADADNAFADLCRNYCAKNGNACYKEAEDYRCKNFMWRGMRED